MPTKPGFETFSGQPVVFRGHRLIPFHQTLYLGWPSQSGPRGGLIWNRPVAVLVTRPDGSEQILPVSDPTRQALLLILGLTAGATLLAWLRRK